ncbi:twin-arginine protein translocation system subunit TatC [mine drainage metagenome]|uniref:Twin-arginine protein translocation system subunit TatC n=3 Tax=mine drainage metagenome TaxID=410659 RepID=T0ZSY6_9ZZZZ
MTEGREAKWLSPALVAYLVELRRRLLISAAVFVAAFLALLPWANPLFGWLAHPLLAALPPGGHLIAIHVTTTFVVPFKLTLLVALLVCMPVLLYELWAFVAPALYRKERRFVRTLMVVSIALFYVGIAFAYFVIFPMAFHFFASVAPRGVAMTTDIQNYLNFCLHLMLAFGISFEMPVVIVLLVFTSLIQEATLRRNRRYVFLICFIIAAFLTPPDALSMTLLGLPMYGLYELGLVLVRWLLPGPVA